MFLFLSDTTEEIRDRLISFTPRRQDLVEQVFEDCFVVVVIVATAAAVGWLVGWLVG